MKEIIILKDNSFVYIVKYIIIICDRYITASCWNFDVNEFEYLLNESYNLKFCLLNYKNNLVRNDLKKYFDYRINNLKNENIKIIMKDKFK